ncbi:MAG TPA: tRNA (N(6)-L-threonylcarbamoyladenosine(37)-C(2))-methylthiotransferase MtaB [Rickettsiales bacterium]|nr:tRNA (N(6)-L-threonylcarbamoyladenosine(37)-C(2))-methylthiotransferase MtaB [Rickettsiales bacterium]
MIKLITFGCRLNTYESEVIKTFLKDREEDIIIFNSCTVTSEAEKQLRQAIRKERKENPKAIIGVVGCAVQTNGEIYKNMEEVDFVLGNADKMKKENYDLISKITNIFESNELAPQIITGFEERTRGFIQIQSGCDNHCTFCATRLARGKSISISSQKIIEQINVLVNNGYKEIVLTGIDITDYGKRLGEDINLGKLMKKILKETDLPRLKLSSIDIADVNDDLKDVLFNEERVMPHIHISLQSGDNTVLRYMARRHNREQVIEFCNEIRKYRKNIGIGADLIAGFPQETEEMHQNSCKLIQEIGLVYGHIFPYSVRENTPAALMKQVPVDVRRIRARELRELTNKQLQEFTKEQMKLPHKILIESETVGRTENYLNIKLPEKILEKHKVGDIIDYEEAQHL